MLTTGLSLMLTGSLLILLFVIVRTVALVRLYKVSKPSQLSIAGRLYNSFDQLLGDIALGLRLWRKPDLIRLADPCQRRYLASIRLLGIATLAAVTFPLVGAALILVVGP